MLYIKKIREHKKLTQDKVIELSGVGSRMYIDYENEKKDIPFSKLQDIALALKVSISELIGEKEYPYKEELSIVNESKSKYGECDECKSYLIKLAEKDKEIERLLGTVKDKEEIIRLLKGGNSNQSANHA